MTPTRFRDRYIEALWSPNALKPNEILVALAYAKYAGAKDPKTGERAPEDVAWVEWATLSDMTGLRSRDALWRATRGLIEAGWMKQAEGARQHRSPRYLLTVPINPEVRHTYLCDQDDS